MIHLMISAAEAKPEHVTPTKSGRGPKDEDTGYDDISDGELDDLIGVVEEDKEEDQVKKTGRRQMVFTGSQSPLVFSTRSFLSPNISLALPPDFMCKPISSTSARPCALLIVLILLSLC